MLFSNQLGNILFFITGMAAAFRPLLFGGMAQLGARLNGIQEVGGSIPLNSTMILLSFFANKYFHVFHEILRQIYVKI